MKNALKIALVIAILTNVNVTHSQITSTSNFGDGIAPSVPLSLFNQRQAQFQQIQVRNQYLISKSNAIRHKQELLNELNSDSERILYEFPSLKHLRGAERYLTAFDSLAAMLEGRTPLSLKKAVYLVEDAFMDGRIAEEWYKGELKSNAKFILEILRTKGFGERDDMAKKMLLHQFLSDTLLLKDEANNVVRQSFPKTYDFHDINGQENWTQMFVTKLMTTGTGQCHSLPLFYLLLAEELDVEAYLAFSPEHSYIKIQDDLDIWHNLELTNGNYSTDAWLLASGYIKAEAIKNDLYLRPLNKKLVIANCLVDLAMGFQQKFGLDSFVLKCVETTLQYDSKNIFALQLLSDYQTYRLQYVIEQIGYPQPEKLSRFPMAYQLYQDVKTMYSLLDQLGYEHMPEIVYKEWLKTLEKNKQLQAKSPRA